MWGREGDGLEGRGAGWGWARSKAWTQGSKSRFLAPDGALYVAPEVIRREDTECPSADMWSFGCCVLEMLTRRYR